MLHVKVNPAVNDTPAAVVRDLGHATHELVRTDIRGHSNQEQELESTETLEKRKNGRKVYIG